MEFRILGPLEVLEDERRLDLVGAKQRSLLAMLLLHPNQVVSNDRLVDALWHERPPATAPKAVQVYVVQLRKLLGKERVETRPPGYRLRVESGELDLDRFQALVEEARQLDPESRSRRLRQALALWRGQALGDLSHEDFAQPEIARLEELRLACVEERIEAELACGRHAGLVGELETLAAEHPLRERLRRQLMLALYRSGRQAEALETYQGARRALTDELGIEPEKSLRELERAILRQDASLDLAAPLPRGTVTLLFSDVEDSTRLIRTLGARYGEALATHRRLMREAFEAHAGVEVDTQGDSFLVAFARARDAVDAAADAQRALAAHAWSDGEPLTARIGIHTGEPDVSPGGYYVGLALTRGARICAAAHGRQVLLSQATRDVIGEGINTLDLGEYVLRGLPAPERLFQLVMPDLPLHFPPPSARRVGNLPRPRTPLIGRRNEVERVLALLAESPVVTLTGPGGVGKTRLALEVAREAATRFDDGAHFVALSAVEDPVSVASTVTQALDIAEGRGESAAAALERSLRNRRALLVLDSFERVLGAATLVSDLVDACPHLRVLATSRERLHVAVETEHAVPPLQESDAMALFAARAAAARPEMELAADDDETVLAICRRLDGLPLAIELAAARVRLLPLAAIFERLELRLPFLTGGSRDLPARQQTLSATIDWSYALLDADEQRALMRLAVFAGGFSLSAAADLLGEDEVALRLLSSLRDKSLVVTRTAVDGSARFGMLDMIREYALARLRADEPEGEAQERHARFFARLAETADCELRGAHQASWLTRLADDHENFQAALAWARDSGADEILLRLAGALWRFWFSRGHVHEGRGWVEEALRRRPGASEALARALFGASTLAVADGDLEAARAFGRERLAVCRTLGDASAIASALSALANTTAALGDYGAARDLYEQAAEAAGAAEAWPELASTMNNLGYLSLLESDSTSAIARCSDARQRFAELGFREDFAGAGLNVAMAFLREGQADEASAIVADSLSTYAELGHDDGVSYALDAAAAGAVQLRDDLWRGALLAGAAAALRQRTGTSPPPLERGLHESTLAELGVLLGAELPRALAEGGALSPQDAVACAHEVLRSRAGRPGGLEAPSSRVP